MDTFRAYRSPGTDRFLSLLTGPGAAEPQNSPSANGGGGSVGVELDEEEIFWTGGGSDSSDPVRSPPQPPPLKPHASTSPSSSSSSARLIPVIPKPKADLVPAPPVGNLYHHRHPQSAPINISIVRREQGMSTDDDDDGDEDSMPPPHEFFARRSGTSPMTTFSVLEGAGRTLKGRDLRRVRNAVWRKTGFLN